MMRLVGLVVTLLLIAPGLASGQSPVVAYGPDYVVTLFGSKAPLQVFPSRAVIDGDLAVTGALALPGLPTSTDPGSRPLCVTPSGQIVLGDCAGSGQAPTPTPPPGNPAAATWANVRRFGADPSASAAVNRAAMQAAHDSLPDKGGVLYIPAGVYQIDAELTVTKSITVRGDGMAGDGLCCGSPADTAAGSALWMTSPTANGIRVNAPGGVTIRDLSLVRDRLADPTNGASIYITGASNNDFVFVENVHIFNAFYAVYIDKAQECRLQNIRVMNTRRDGIVLMNTQNSDQGTCDLVSIGINATGNNGIHDYTPAPGSAAILVGAGGLTLTGSHIEGIYDYGIRIATETLSTNTGNATIAASYIEGFKKTALYLDGGGPFVYGSVVFTGNVVNTNESGVTGVTIESSFADIVIGSNKFYFYNAPGSKGVYIAGGSTNLVIAGNAFAGMSSGVQIDPSGVQITAATNGFDSAVVAPMVGGTPGTLWTLTVPALFAQLPNGARNGSMLACTDCRAVNPCASGGSGALAKRFGGAWVCN